MQGLHSKTNVDKDQKYDFLIKKRTLLSSKVTINRVARESGNTRISPGARDHQVTKKSTRTGSTFTDCTNFGSRNKEYKDPVAPFGI